MVKLLQVIHPEPHTQRMESHGRSSEQEIMTQRFKTDAFDGVRLSALNVKLVTEQTLILLSLL